MTSFVMTVVRRISILITNVIIFILIFFIISIIIVFVVFGVFGKYAVSYGISGPVPAWRDSYNNRNDRVEIVTYDFIYSHSPTIVYLGKYTHAFSKEILRIDGGSFVIGAKWRGDDSLAVQIGLGPGEKISTLVRQVGPIHIDYYFIKPGKPAPASDVSPLAEICPAPYLSAFWNCRGEANGWVGLSRGWLVK